MKNFDFEAFKKELKEKTIESFIEYKQKCEIDDLCGFAFYTDDFTTLSVFVNTYSKLEEEEDEITYFRFTVDEWDNEEYPNEKLDSVNTLLNEVEEKDGCFLDMKYIADLLNCLTEVILEMKEERFFEGVKDDFVWNIKSDYDNPPLEIEIARKLNTPEVADEFEQYLINEYKICGTDEWSYEKGKWVNHD